MFFKKEKIQIPEVPIPYKNECQKIVECLVCPCNGKLYKNIKQHRTTVIHKNWELPQKNKDLEILATKLTAENDHLKRLNVILTNNILILEENLKKCT
jgi:hypothetical protein